MSFTCQRTPSQSWHSGLSIVKLFLGIIITWSVSQRLFESFIWKNSDSEFRILIEIKTQQLGSILHHHTSCTSSLCNLRSTQLRSFVYILLLTVHACHEVTLGDRHIVTVIEMTAILHPILCKEVNQILLRLGVGGKTGNMVNWYAIRGVSYTMAVSWYKSQYVFIKHKLLDYSDWYVCLHNLRCLHTLLCPCSADRTTWNLTPLHHHLFFSLFHRP